MNEREFKKLLIDLDLSLTDIAEAVGISSWAVTLYFRGELKSDARRRRIKRLLVRRARERGVELPEFWPDIKAA